MRINRACFRVALLPLLAVLAAVTARAEPPKPVESKSQFLRLSRDAKDRPDALEAAIVRFGPAKGEGPAVDLVAAVHVAEKSYYQQLNREFAGYDAVLYELVAPEGAVPKPGRGGDSPVSMLQHAMKNVLELEFQLEAVDYDRPNMVHADMSPQEFAESMRKRGESVLGMFLRMMGHAMAQQSAGGSSDAQLLMALFSKDRALALKRVLAEQFEQMEGTLTVLEGPQGSTLVSERNKVALDVLRDQLAAGKKKIAIFYGAGHMPDISERLRDDFGLVPKSTRWLVAWKLKK